jgi:hypothetical protein
MYIILDNKKDGESENLILKKFSSVLLNVILPITGV